MISSFQTKWDEDLKEEETKGINSQLEKGLLEVEKNQHRMETRQIPRILGGSSSVWEQEEVAGMGKIQVPPCSPLEFWRKGLIHQHHQ